MDEIKNNRNDSLVNMLFSLFSNPSGNFSIGYVNRFFNYWIRSNRCFVFEIWFSLAAFIACTFRSGIYLDPGFKM